MNVRKQKPPKENSHAFEIEGRLVMRAEGTEFDFLVGSGVEGDSEWGQMEYRVSSWASWRMRN